MNSHKQLVVGLFAAILALMAGFYIGSEVNPAEPPPEVVLSPEAIASFLSTRLNDTEGKPQSLMQWQKKILVINFWATWCSPCREEMPVFSRLQQKYAEKGVQFVGISLDSADRVIQYSKQYPVSYPLLVAFTEGAELTQKLGNNRLALPYTVVLDGKGEARLTKLGRLSEQELEALLQKLTKR